MNQKLKNVLCDRFCKGSFKCAECHGLEEDYQTPYSDLDSTVVDVEDIYTIANPEQAAQLKQCSPDKCWECNNVLC